jgi:putative transposase
MQTIVENRSKSVLKAHIVLTVKYRRSLLGEFGGFVIACFYEVAQTSDFIITEIEQDGNHIHLLIRYSSKISISSIVRRLKQISSVRLYENYENELKRYFWKRRVFWSAGYYTSSVGELNEETVSEYIRNQGRSSTGRT